MNHKTFRVLLSLVLVCVLLIGLSPIRARAMMPVVGWDGLAWTLSEIIASGAIGIGTSPGAVPDDWNNMIEKAKQACVDFFGLAGTTMKIYSFFDGSSYKYYAKADFVEWLRDWMFDSGYIETSGAIYDGSLYTRSYTGTVWGDCSCTSPANFWLSGFKYGSRDYTLICLASKTYFTITKADGTTTSFQSNNFTSYNGMCYKASWSSATPSPGYSFYGDLSTFASVDTASKYIIDKYFSAFLDYSVDDGLSASFIAPQDISIGEGYPEWVANSVLIPTTVTGLEEEVVGYPLGLGQTLEETQGLTQEQIWAGESTLQVEIDTEAFEGTVSMTRWETFKQWMSGIWTSITDSIISVKEAVLSIPAAIADVIADIFIPSEDFLTVKFEAIRAEFAFADSIMTSGDMVLDVLNGINPEPPVIYIDLGASEGSYDIGGEVPFLDLRWYERYKPTGDAIISAFLWLVFVWRMFIKLPGIIGGLPGDFVMQGVVNLGLSEHLPARKKEYEYERQQNRRSMRK